MPEYNCRVCWNSQGWRFPTGDAAQLESGTYVTHHAFGHEEWLFNLEWIIDGRKYGHLQPISPSRRKRCGESLDLFLYAYGPERHVFDVGTITGARILDDAEAELAVSEFRERGWLGEMAKDLEALEVDPSPILGAFGSETFNVAFDPNRVTRSDPLRPLLPGDPRRPTVNRYILTEGSSRHQGAPSRPSGSTSPTKTALVASRRAVGSTQVQLRHTRLQNQLFEFLESRGHNVKYEEGYVDLRLVSRNGDTLLELKTASTARACIREGIGQLLEYGHFGDATGAKCLAVVGRPRPDSTELRYLEELRSRYRLPLQYWAFSLDSEGLTIFPET